MAYKVLVIDDEPDVVKYLESVLTDDGYEVKFSYEGDAGFDIARKWSPHVICLDIMMPRQSGLSIFRKFKADDLTKAIPVIILTGIEKGDGFDFNKWVGDDSLKPPEVFMEKPIKIKNFLETVAGLIVAGKVNSK